MSDNQTWGARILLGLGALWLNSFCNTIPSVIVIHRPLVDSHDGNVGVRESMPHLCPRVHYQPQRLQTGGARRVSEISGRIKLTIPHVVRSASKSNEFVQKRKQQKIYPTHMYFKGQYSLKLFTVGFLIFENSGFQIGQQEAPHIFLRHSRRCKIEF